MTDYCIVLVKKEDIMKQLTHKQWYLTICAFIAVLGGAFLVSFVQPNPNTNTPIIATEHASIEKQTVETNANKYHKHRNEYYGESSLVKLANDSYAHVYVNTASFGTYQPAVKKIMNNWNQQVGYDIFKNAAKGVKLSIKYHSNNKGISTITTTHVLEQGSYLKSLKDVNQDQIELNLPKRAKNDPKLVTDLISLELKHCLGVKTSDLNDTKITKSDLATVFNSLELS